MSNHSLSDTSNSIEPEGSPANFGDGGAGDNPQPGNHQPGNPQPDNPQPDDPEPDDPQPDNTQPDNPQPDNTQPDNPQPDDPQPDDPQPDAESGRRWYFPDEVLEVIFRLVLDDTKPFVTKGPCCAPPIYRPNPVHIWSFYQTCRQFHRVAAEFLFTHVRVRHLASSIERLEKISQNPGFCRNTSVVQIDLALHNDSDKGSFANFVGTQLDRLRDCKSIPFPPSETEADRTQARTAKQLVLESWGRIHNWLSAETDMPPPSMDQDEPDFKQHQLLLRMWSRYQKMIQEQEILLSTYQNGISFADRVAAAMARMPKLKELRFEDAYPGDKSPNVGMGIKIDREGNIDENSLMDGVADYLPDWAGGRDGRFDLLAEVPVAAHRAGVRFDTMDMRFWRDVDLSMFSKPETQMRLHLTEAFQQVRNFVLVPDDYNGGMIDRKHPAIFLLLDITVLERVFVDFGRTAVDLRPLWYARPGSYSNLKSLVVYGTAVPYDWELNGVALEEFWLRLPASTEVVLKTNCPETKN